MIVGIVKLELYFRGNDSLKGKRSRLNKIKERVKSRFNASVAEVDYLDSHEYSILGISLVGNDKSFINSQKDMILNFINELFLCEIINTYSEMINV